MCGGFVVALQIPPNTPCFALFHSASVVPGEVVYESAGVGGRFNGLRVIYGNAETIQVDVC
jgi:hypothetical protein